MPPRLRFSSSYIPQPVRRQKGLTGPQNEVIRGSRYVSTAPAAAASAAVVPPPSLEQMKKSPSRIVRKPSVQPPSHRRPEERRSQLLRQYTSLIRTAPLMVFFQHNNLQSTEWTAIRRELVQALRKVDDQQAAEGRSTTPLASHVKLQIIQTSIFEVALRIVDHFRPEEVKGQGATAAEDALMHDLSRTVHGAVRHLKGKHELASILSGPLAVLSLPNVSPEHLKAALSVLAPKASGFSAPSRKANPGYHELTVQEGLQKLMLVAARVDGQVFDLEGTKWVGSIESGLDGLRAQLVHALQAVGAGVTSTLEGASKSLYLTMESRRSVLEDEQKGEDNKEQS
jgi:large subunit ribosomal protein L10